MTHPEDAGYWEMWKSLDSGYRRVLKAHHKRYKTQWHMNRSQVRNWLYYDLMESYEEFYNDCERDRAEDRAYDHR